MGASRATGNLIWFLADDFVPTPGALAAHLDARTMRPEPHIVTVGPGRFPQALAAHPFRYWLEHEYDLTRMGFRVPADRMEGFFYAGNLVMCADFYRESGGFDPAFPYEVVFEQEFELRLSRKGMRTLQVPGALADHHHSLCLSEREQVMELAGESCARLKLMHPEHPALLPDCTADAQTHRLRADAARKRFNATRSPESRGDWWRNRLSAAFLDGYQRGWAGIEAAEAFSIAAHLRRLHASRHRLEWKLLAGVPDADGLEQFDTADSQSRTSSEGEFDHLCARNPLGAPFVYFRTAPGFTDSDSPVTITVRARDDVSGSLWIEYDSTDLSVRKVPGRDGAFKQTRPIQLVGDGAWHDHEFSISDGRWHTRYVNGGDFRVVRSGNHATEIRIGAVVVEDTGARTGARSTPAALRAPCMNSPVALTRTSSPAASIIIPMYGRLGYTIQCLQAISDTTTGAFEVIVVDDGSPENPCSWLAGIPHLRFLRREHNGGFAVACNEGAGIARGDWLLFLNNDTIPQPGWLQRLLEDAGENPGTGAVGARLVYPATGSIQHAGVEFDDSGLPHHPHRYESGSAPAATSPRDCPAVTGACLLTPTSVFNALGMFDEGYVNGVEDIDYCLRLAEAGHRIRYCGPSLVGHYESLTRDRVDREANDRNLAMFRREWIETGRLKRLRENRQSTSGR
jgi:GT2 family glycosyltransferase